MNKVIVAAIQAGSYVFDTPRTLEKVKTYCREAAQSGARLVLFPEAFLAGYPKGLDFGIRMGSRSAAGREDFLRYYKAAIALPGPETALLSEVAGTYQINLIIGVVEKENGSLFCSVLFYSADGNLLAKHRKVMPTALERSVWGCGDGSTMPAVNLGFGVVGAAICWENYMPLFRTAMYEKGVTIWCAPTVDDRDSWLATMRHIAVEGRCFVLSAAQFLVRGNCPERYDALQADSPETVLIDGGSLIVSPHGNVLAGPLRGREGLVLAELDLDEVTRGKFDLDVVGHYARPDIFTLSVDERPKQSVVLFSETE